jgi:hypothetical protein
MSNDITKNNDYEVMADIEHTQKICQQLMRTPHYAKLGEAGIFAIVQKAKSIGMNLIEALNGGLYFVQGKVEMMGVTMLSLIRAKGHSVSIDTKSTNSHIIMHGKRADNGDTWTVEFGIDDAKRAGIYRGQWEKYPKVMCIWRCVSMLGRFLFSDVFKGAVYVQGEISEAPDFNEFVLQPKQTIEIISKDQAIELIDIISECSDEYQNKVNKFIKSQGLTSLYDLPVDAYAKLKMKAESERMLNKAASVADQSQSETIEETDGVEE